MTVLQGDKHVSPETAFIVKDYPYGFTLRTEMRVWVETRKGMGQRICTQTKNPKVAGEKWNKPKSGIYHAIVLIQIDDETGHFSNLSLSNSAWDEETKKFEQYIPYMSDLQKKIFNIYRAKMIAKERLKDSPEYKEKNFTEQMGMLVIEAGRVYKELSND
jgi:hypothetical protein